MSDRSETTLAQRVLRGALLVYPKGYRREQGSEIAATYTAATADAGGAEVLREALNVAGHGLRVRLGLTSDRYVGSALAAAVPYLLGTVAGLTGVMFFLRFAGRVNSHYESFHIDTTSLHGTVMGYAPVPVLLTAAALVLSALVGRWSWVRWTAGATVVVAVGTIAAVFEYRRGEHIYVLTTFPGFEMPLMLAVCALLVLAVPADAETVVQQRLQTVMAAFAVVALLAAAWMREGFAWSLITAMPWVVAVVLVLALAAGLRNPLVPGAVALACIPWLIQPLTGDLYDHGYTGTEYVLLVGLAIVLVLAAGHVRHRRLTRSPNR